MKTNSYILTQPENTAEHITMQIGSIELTLNRITITDDVRWTALNALSRDGNGAVSLVLNEELNSSNTPDFYRAGCSVWLGSICAENSTAECPFISNCLHDIMTYAQARN